jgi:hypothetical protein
MLTKTYERVSDSLIQNLEILRNPKYLSITNGRVSIINRSKHRTRSGCVYRKFWSMKRGY